MDTNSSVIPDLTTPRGQPREFRESQKFLDRGEQPPLFYVPEIMTGNTLLWVEKKIIEAIAKFNSKVVFISTLANQAANGTP
jgi:hypothetical protein